MVPDFDKKLREYARLLVEVGLNVQPGQTPFLNATLDCAPLVRLCVAACYDCGARQVVVHWSDDDCSRQWYLRADEAVFSAFPPYAKAQYDWAVEQKCPSLSFTGSDPELLAGVDPRRIQTWRRTSAGPTKPFYDYLETNQGQWCVGSWPTRTWAEKVFPDKKGDAAVDALWDAIFSVCRVAGDGGAVARWHEHVETTARRAAKLNEFRFKSLHYANSLGTDLTIQLPEDHIWLGGAEKTQSGVPFIANIPTEEIFTAPRWDGVDGRACAALPLSLNGNLVENFYLDFRGGKIVNFHAEKGEETLKHSIEMDEGSSYLGEVALVPYDSPIRASGLLFYNTLFDENASCHLAFGSSYPTCVKGGADMDEAAQKAAGLNQSNNHVDFMVGSRDLSIVGVTHDGQTIPVFVNGNFAF